MESRIVNYLQHIALGEPKSYERLTLFPMYLDNGKGPDFLTLGQAMGEQLLTITEVSESGSVGDLKVENKCSRPVLILDGEELIGAKQNRVLNTTILLKEKSETFVPVSCTEQGRWSYLSAEFAESETVMSPSVRQHKLRSVSESMRLTGNSRSNQGVLWNEIDKLSLRAGVNSNTGAMRDVHDSRREQLEKYVKAIKLQEGQTGLLVLISGVVIGFENVSRPDAFANLYPKLLRSYAMDAILSQSDHLAARPDELAREFLQIAALTGQSEHKSLGYGKDYRFTGDVVVGSALEVNETLVHLAFFRTDASGGEESISSSHRSRRFRE